MHPRAWDTPSEASSSPSTSTSSRFDEDEVNYRVTPHWPSYRHVFDRRGFRLQTMHDAKQFFRYHSPKSRCPNGGFPSESDLCHDASLPGNLFRGVRICDGLKIMVKAVHILSREHDVIRRLSTPPLSDDPMNRTIPVLDFIDIVADGLTFIVMEEWSPIFRTESSYSLRAFLGALRQCIEHVVFMHRHHLAHLDISMWNILTNSGAKCAYIDFETSRNYAGIINPAIRGYRGTEIPPECNDNDHVDPYKIDVWALAVFILRACKMTGHDLPELMYIVEPMLREAPCRRPSVECVLQAFDMVISRMPDVWKNRHANQSLPIPPESEAFARPEY